MAEPRRLDIHKALADDTRFRLYRYLGLTGRPVTIREISRRLSLHPNTLRPHLRRLQEAGLVVRDVRRTSTVGRPQTLYAVAEPETRGADDYRLLAEILVPLIRGKRLSERAHQMAREWGEYLVAQGSPKPGVRLPPRRNLAMLQEGMARAGFEPRFRRGRASQDVEVTLRSCPFRELTEDHREAVCLLHRGLLEGLLEGLKPPMRLGEFQPFVDRTTCRLTAAPAG